MSRPDRPTIGIPEPELPGGREEFSQTPNEMRAAIFASCRTSELVRRCISVAQRDGLCGEDTMTLIAYYALRVLDDQIQTQMQTLLSVPPEGDVSEGAP